MTEQELRVTSDTFLARVERLHAVSCFLRPFARRGAFPSFRLKAAIGLSEVVQIGKCCEPLDILLAQ